MTIEVLLIIVPNWPEPRCPSTEGWIIMADSYNGILLSDKRKGTDTHVSIDERSLTQKGYIF